MRNIYLLNKNKVGKVDDVFGLMSTPGIAIQPDEGVKAESFKVGDKLYADPYQLREASFFKSKPMGPKVKRPTG